MGQKVNPIALRLKTTNKNFASCWYSNTGYSQLLSQEIRIKAYLRKLLDQIRYPNPIVSVSFAPKRIKVLTLYLNPTELRRRRGERFQLNSSTLFPGGKRRGPGSQLDSFLCESYPSLPLSLSSQREWLSALSVGVEEGKRSTPLRAPMQEGDRGDCSRGKKKRNAAFLPEGDSLAASLMALHPLGYKGLLDALGRRGGDHATSSQLPLLPWTDPDNQGSPRGIVSTCRVKAMNNLEIGNGKSGGQLVKGFGRAVEMRSLVCNLLVSLVCQKMRAGQLLVGKDFDLFNRTNRILWFLGRAGISQARLVPRQAGVPAIGDLRKPYRGKTKEAVTPRGDVGRPHSTSMQFLDGTGSFLTDTRSHLVGASSCLAKRGEAWNRLSQVRFSTWVSIDSQSHGSTPPRIALGGESKGAPSYSLLPMASQGPRKGAAPFPSPFCTTRLPQIRRKRHTSAPNSWGGSHSLMCRDKELLRRRRQLRLTCIELSLCNGLTSSVTLYLYKSVREEQTAQFLSGEIAFYLERRVPFRRLKQFLIRDLQNSQIEGVRVRCSGRVGGRSKKAQRAKEEGFQWGQTSSHVFSSRLSFNSRSALTPLGKVGIKVWVCFK
jgi:ribosomal protein S3